MLVDALVTVDGGAGMEVMGAEEEEADEEVGSALGGAATRGVDG